MKEIKIRNVSKKKHAKTKKKRQKEEIKQKREIRKVKRAERIKEKKEQKIEPLKSSILINNSKNFINASGIVKLQEIREQALRIDILENRRDKIKTIFDSKLNLLPPDEIDINFLKELYELYTLTLLVPEYSSSIRKNIDEYINIEILSNPEIKKIRERFLKKLNNPLINDEFEEIIISYLKEIFLQINYQYDNNDYKHIRIPAWAELTKDMCNAKLII